MTSHSMEISLFAFKYWKFDIEFRLLSYLLEESKLSFNVICLIETWPNYHEFKTNSNYHLPNYKRIYYETKTSKIGGGVLVATEKF